MAARGVTIDKMAGALCLSLVMAMLLAPGPAGADPKCPERSNCSCASSGEGHFEIVCPMTGPSSFTVKFYTGRLVHLHCHQNVRPEDYSMLPSLPILNTRDVESFTFDMCPLPTSPLAEVIARLGVSKLRSLFFQTYGRNLSNTLKRNHLKGLEGLSRLVLSGNGLTDLPEDLFIDMANLTWLNLRSNKILLTPDLFKFIPQLQSLELGHNELPALPKGLFKHLGTLKLLNLWQNSLTNLSGEVFEGLNTLETLDLSSNKLETLPSDVFYNIPNLRLLNLYSNNLSYLPSDLFSANPKLEILKLFDNKQSLKILPEGLLSNLTKLTEVKLYRCKIEVVAESLFWGSTEIKNMSLEGNALTEIPKDLLRDQTKLEDLNLAYNQIQSIPDGAFSSLTNLLVLNLDENHITHLSGKIFNQLVALQRLSITKNKLSSVHMMTFSRTENLQEVDMSHNNLSFMESSMLDYNEYGMTSPFKNLNNVKFLNLSHNEITEIFSDWRLTSLKLRILDLSHNKFFKIAFEDVHFINNDLVLDLRSNNISEINFNSAMQIAISQNVQQPDAYHGNQRPAHNVKILIEDNPIFCDCVLYYFVLYMRDKLDPQVRSLVSVNVGSTTCTGPDELKGRLLTHLRPEEMLCPLDVPQSKKPALCPKGCKCDVRPFDLGLLVNCSSSDNQKSPIIPDVGKLQLAFSELHFENSGLNSLSGISRMNNVSYNQIGRLFVSGNNITHFHNDDIPNKIEVLDLRNNYLGTLEPSVTDELINSTTLKKMYLSGNPIECSCENEPFLSFLQTNYKKIQDYSNVSCSDNVRVSRVSLGDLCGTTPTVIASSVVVALVGLILGVLAALYYKYQQEVKVWLFSKGLCLWWVTEVEIDKDKLYDAFISFSHKDEDFIVNKLVPELEGGPHPFKICLHFRDWVAGEWIPTQIARSVEDSRRTLVVLSPNFLESVWGRMEFRAAHSRALKEGRARVVVILYGDIGPMDNLDAELQAYLSMNTYVKWGDPWFWNKLRYALPHPPHKHQVPAHNVSSKKGFDDRLELIHPTTPTTPPGQNTPPAHQAHTNPLMNHVNSVPNGVKSPNMMNGTITMNGLKVNGNAKHSDV